MSGPKYIIHHVTDNCPLRCDFCFVHINQTKQSETVAASVAAKLKDYSRPIFVVLTGGETLSTPALQLTIQDYIELHKPLAIHITTSGYLPPKLAELWQWWSNYKRNNNVATALQFSLSYDGSNHNQSRGRTDAIEQLRQSFAICRQQNIPFAVTYTLTRFNINSFQNDLDELKTLLNGSKSLKSIQFALERSTPASFPPTSGDGNSGFGSIEIPFQGRERQRLIAIYRKLISEARHLHKHTPLGLWQYVKSRKDKAIYQTVLKQLLGQNNSKVNCSAGDRIISIDTIGNIVPCENKDYVSGNIITDSTKTIQKADKQFQARISKEKCRCSHECYIGVSALGRV